MKQPFLMLVIFLALISSSLKAQTLGYPNLDTIKLEIDIISINKSKMRKYIEPIPGVGLIKTDHEFIHFWRINANQLAIWLGKTTKECTVAEKNAGPECYTFTIPLSKEIPQLFESLRIIGVKVSRQIKKGLPPSGSSPLLVMSVYQLSVP